LLPPRKIEPAKLPNALVKGIEHIVDVFFLQGWIYTNPEGLIHHKIGVVEITYHTITDVLIRRLPNQVPSKQLPGGNALGVD